MKEVAEEDIEPLTEDPGSLILDNPVLHLTQPLLLLSWTQSHDSPHQVLEIFHMLK